MDDAQTKTTAAIIVAAGRGTRVGGDIAKQWQALAGRRVIDWTLDAFKASDHVDRIVVVLHPDDVNLLSARENFDTVTGGDTRTASVRAGLEYLAKDPPDNVLIHDAARACVSQRLIVDMAHMLDRYDGVAPGVAVTDALWRASTIPGNKRSVDAIASRENLFRAQTPQGFRFSLILDAHRTGTTDAADDVELAIASGIQVAIGPGEEDNLKITTPGDFARAERILMERTGGMDVRVGNGFDVHAFGPGDHVTLCGIDVPFDKGLVGHSDADVGMHAVTDALYGAMAEGDIGRHFPPSDPQWKGAESHIFLEHAAQLAVEKGYTISNVDCTLICEMPKIGPHADRMREALAAILGIDADRVSVKATTSEQLGFTGRGEGIAASATATLVRT